VTGVELCSAMCRMFTRTMRELYPAVPPEAVRVTLLEAGEQLLATVREEHRRAAEQNLRELGVQVRCRARVREVRADAIELDGGENLPAALCAWTAGVRAATPLEGWPDWPVGRGARVPVIPSLEVPGHPDVWLIGDGAAHDLGEGRVTPMTAQVAVQMGQTAARNVRRSIGEHGAGRAGRPFRWKDRGMFVGLGPRSTFATVLGVPVSGRLVWLAWALVYMVKMVSLRRQLEIAFDFLKGTLARHDTSLTLPTGAFGPIFPEDTASSEAPSRTEVRAE
jgi:NADH dehydrogenase